MYTPRWFKEERLSVLHEAIEKIGFGTLVTSGRSGILASHLPMFMEKAKGPKGILVGHMARGNSQWRESKGEESGLAMFLGPNAYISPSWYQTRVETGEVVPTWNYIAVHVRGPVTFFDDKKRLLEIVIRLTEQHEAYSGDAWKVADAPAEYVEKELESVVGFEMPVDSIEGKWKLSQNRPPADREGARRGLVERGLPGDETVSNEMLARDGSQMVRGEGFEPSNP